MKSGLFDSPIIELGLLFVRWGSRDRGISHTLQIIPNFRETRDKTKERKFILQAILNVL